MKTSIVIPLALACGLLPDAAVAQEDRSAPTRLVRLSDGSAIRHDQYDGVLWRLAPDGRQVARVKVPSAEFIEKQTDIVVSKDEARLLVAHRASTFTYPQRHRVMILDALSLRTIQQLPLGDCRLLDFRQFLEYVTVLCHDSQDPAEKKRRKTLALVTLDLNRAQVVRWFDVGGKRRGNWFGPMFFGYTDDAYLVRVTTEDCAVIPGREARPDTLETVDASEHPAQVIVIARHDNPIKGDVWFVGPDQTDAPRRVATLARTPYSARLCGETLVVTLRDQ